jgi:hypothetical protein
VKDHVHSFGSVEGGKMKLSDNGVIALEQWKWLKDQYPYIDLISFVSMPDHVHGIIYIDTDFYKYHVGNGRNVNVGNGRNVNVGNGRDRSLQVY